ncbi:GIY-YIG nuclease family protein [Stenotrophomonas sp. GD03657]|uniref:GIY-YIG nuclease family protein n=1 Tax=Stenotrophomonas sp. GD03657 TaxID=2975363 RepID=UPI002447B281|nr:GIY-YIG nuclease family protein [Stenotrophomonas sp. GD03657]MDH2154219.1 GIY-YIG nuclease family protein [Stenotrophomonas sp. GD03657]
MKHTDKPLTHLTHKGDRNKRNPVKGYPGAYKVVHTLTGTYYIGSTGNLGLRWNSHRHELQNGRHLNPKLQSVFTTIDDYEFHYFQTDTLAEAREMEAVWIRVHASDPLCVNYTGTPPPETTRKKISAAHLGKPKTTEHAANISKYYREHGLKPELMEQLKGRTDERNPNAKAVEVDGVRYPTGSAAARALGLARSVFQRRLESASWPTYRYTA